MRKKGCNLGDKKLMNSSSCKASQTRKTSSKKEGPSRVIYPSSYHTPMTKVTSLGKWSLFKKFFLDFGRHISKKQTCSSYNLFDPI